MGISKYNNGYGRGGYIIDNINVVIGDSLWNHTVDRIEAAEKKAKSRSDFKKKMITRLGRIKHKEKIYYAIAVLHEKGYSDIVEVYDSRLVMDALLDEDY